MASGLPVIVSSNVGSSDLVENTLNGIIFRSGDVEDLKRAINILYSNKELRDSMSEKSRLISELYSWKSITKTLVQSLNL
jgi:glycosyltransferase involved in cell wall biosynthesis